MDNTKLIATLSKYEREVLPLIAKTSLFEGIVKASTLKDVEVMRGLQWLQNKKIINLREEVKEVVDLGENGLKYLKQGLPEYRFLKTIEKAEKSIDQIQKQACIEKDEVNISIGVLKRKAAITIQKKKNKLYAKITDNGKKLLSKPSLEQQFFKLKFPVETKNLSPEQKFALDNLKKRKQIAKIELNKLKFAELTELGKKLLKIGIKQGDVIDRLTPKMIKTGEWKNSDIRAYDVGINVPKVYLGKRHFVNEAIEYARRIWLDMGFKEMTGPLLQTSLWNFDTLFVPQDHPARELQDTFYIKDPKFGKLLDKSLINRIKQTHENGWTTGSKGWQYKWSEQEAKKNVMRPHTTVLSSRTLAALKKTELPAKFFAIGKCFRNETLDAHHLFEFNQTEGIVIDPDANFRHLLGYLKEFAMKMGYKKVRFRPAYFPYTEPSVEGDVYDPVHKKWIEVIAAGVFRPEVVKPLLGEDIPVLAWGPGLDRIITGVYGITDIRDLYKNDLRQLRETKAWLL